MDGLFKFILHPVVGINIAWIYVCNGGIRGVRFLEKIEEANSCIASKNFTEALRICDELIGSHDYLAQKATVKANVYVVRSSAHKGLGDLNRALEDCQAAIALCPDKVEAHQNLGVILAGIDRLAEAEKCFDRAVELDPKNPLSYVNRAFVLMNMDRSEEALLNCQIALGIDPTHMQARVNAAGIKSKLGRGAEALDDCSEILKLDPDNSTALINRGVIYLRQGKLQESLADFNRGIDLGVGIATGNAYAGRAGVFVKLKRFDEAIADCDRALDINDNNNAAWLNKVYALKRMKKYREAIQVCNLALKQNLDKDSRRKCSAALAGALVELGDFTSAIEVCDEALREDKDKVAYAFNVRAWALAHMGEFERAGVDVRRALELEPDNAAQIGTSGLILLGQGRYDEAFEALNKALKLNPNDFESYFFRAEVYKKLGEEALARKDAEKSLESGYELPQGSFWRRS